MSASVTNLPHSMLAGVVTTPTFSGRLVYLQFTWGSAPPFLLSSGHPTLFATCLFSVACLLYSFVVVVVVFVGQGSVCPGGYAGLSQGWLWGYCMLLIFSPVGLRLSSRLRVSAWWHGSPPVFSVYCGMGKLCAGWGVEVLEFCLFLVVFPARCVSSISARFLL
jgi:hypothetical protein